MALVVIGVAVGVSVSKSHKNNNNASSSSAANGSPGAVQSDPNNPSNFVKDPRLHKSFYALAYTPENAIIPNCNVTLGEALVQYGWRMLRLSADAVIQDIQLMSQLTNVRPMRFTRNKKYLMQGSLFQVIRLYGADCNQTSVVLDAIARTSVNMSVYVGNYVVPGDNTGYMRQRNELETAFKQFGVQHVAGW